MRRKRILVVDDHPYVLAGLAGYLRRMAEFEVALAMGAEDARQRLDQGGGFAVIVTDLHMPGGDGEQLLEHVMTTYPDMRRIVLTGDSVSEQAQRVRFLCHRFLEKPCDPCASPGGHPRRVCSPMVAMTEQPWLAAIGPPSCTRRSRKIATGTPLDSRFIATSWWRPEPDPETA